MKSLSQLVQTKTDDDLVLTGVYSSGDINKEAIISIHGFGTDFYTHKFNHDISDALQENKNAIVLAQTRGTGLFTEFVSTDRSKGINIGSYYEKIENAHIDISAWIDFLKIQGYSKFIIMGHSLGTIKAVRYLFEGKYKEDISKLILLAPFDKNGYVENKTKGGWHENNKVAEQKIAEGKGQEIIPDTFDDFPMTYTNYLSWYKESDLNSIWDFYKPEYISPILQKITLPVSVIIGDQDTAPYTEGLGGSLEKTNNYLKSNIKNLDLKIIPNADHCYIGQEAEVVKNILSFLK